MDSFGYWNTSLLSNHDQSSSFLGSSTTLSNGVGVSPRFIMPTPSPQVPWRTRRSTISNSYQLYPFKTIPSNSPHAEQFLRSMNLPRHQIGDIVLCQVIPVGAANSHARHRRLKRVQNEPLCSKRRAAVKRSFTLANLKTKQLKRLHRGQILKTKKQEIFDKWKCKKQRRKFRSKQKLNKTNLGKMNSFLFQNECSVPSFECPLWWCKKKTGQRTSRSSSRPRSRTSSASNLSRRRSRSPIIFRRQ